MSIYTLYRAPTGTCTADAWGPGMEVREAWGLLTSFLIFRMSLYFHFVSHVADIFLKRKRAKTNTSAFLQTFHMLALKSLHKVEMYFLKFAERFWSSVFMYGPSPTH